MTTKGCVMFQLFKLVSIMCFASTTLLNRFPLTNALDQVFEFDGIDSLHFLMCQDEIQSIVHFRWRQLLVLSAKYYYIYDFNLRNLTEFGSIATEFPFLKNSDFVIFSNSYYLFYLQGNRINGYNVQTKSLEGSANIPIFEEKISCITVIDQQTILIALRERDLIYRCKVNIVNGQIHFVDFCKPQETRFLREFTRNCIGFYYDGVASLLFSKTHVMGHLGTINLPTKKLNEFLNCPVWISSMWNVHTTNYTVVILFLLGTVGLFLYYMLSPSKISIDSSDLRIVIRHIEVMQQLQEAIIDEAIKEQEATGMDLKVSKTTKIFAGHAAKKYELSPLMMKDIQARLRSKRQASGLSVSMPKTLFTNMTRKMFSSKFSTKSSNTSSVYSIPSTDLPSVKSKISNFSRYSSEQN